MKVNLHAIVTAAMIAMMSWPAMADNYSDTVKLFQDAGQSSTFFGKSYGYAVFPTVTKGGLGVGAAHGSGRVYQADQYVGDTSVTQVSVGLQAGGQAFSQIIFFEDQRAFDEFTSGHFEFDASVSAVAITASAQGSAGTSGTNAGAAGGKNDATTAGGFHKGIAVFMIVKGGAMAEAAVGGQKFSYKPRKTTAAPQ